MTRQYVILLITLIAAPIHAVNPVKLLLQENRIDEALPICRQYEVLSSTDKDVLFSCAWIFLRSDRPESAEKFMEKIKRNFATPEYQLLVAFSKAKKKQVDDAKRILNSVYSEQRGTSYALTAQELQAELYELMGQPDTAAFIYKQVVGEDSRRARSHWGLGRYYLSKGDPRRALAHLEQTARLWPKHLGVRFNLGVVSLSQDNLTEATRWLSECYKLDKGDAGVHEQIGILFEKKGVINQAIKHWQRALVLKKDSPIAKEKLGQYLSHVVDALIAAKRYDQALAKIESLRESLAESPRLLFRRGLIYRYTGKFQKASKDIRAYLQTNPNDAFANRELGICYVNLKLFNQAGIHFERAALAEPDNGMNHAWLAFVLEQKRDLRAAQAEWKKALELLSDPEEIEKATRRLSSIEKRLGKGKKKKIEEEDE